MTLEDKVHGFPLHLFRRAQELGNVSAACEHPFRVVKRLWGVRQDEVPRDRQEPRPSPDDVRLGQPLRRPPLPPPSGGEGRPVTGQPPRAHHRTPGQGETRPLDPDDLSAQGARTGTCAEVP